MAGAVRERYGRGCALVEQDYLRRIVLGERDVEGGIARRTAGNRTTRDIRPQELRGIGLTAWCHISVGGARVQHAERRESVGPVG